MSGAQFKVLDGGLQTTLQDGGRRGLLALGVPRSGALDQLSWRLGNRLVGNEREAAALELRSPGPALRLEGSARIALTGTSAGLLIERRGDDVQEWPSWRAIDLADGDVLRVLPFADTAVAYLAVQGGFQAQAVFGSQSTFLRGAFGGFAGRGLRAGDDLPLAAERVSLGPCLTLLTPPSFAASPVLRALEGPQAGYFTAAARELFFTAPFAVTRDLDRMGIRLDGPLLERARVTEMPSDATVAGAIQVPGDTRAILLLNDCQTTGGYPKIATVISADLPAAGRLVPGAEVRFRRVDVLQAVAARAEAREVWRHLLEAVAPVRA